MNRREAEYYISRGAKYEWAMRSIFHNVALTLMRCIVLPFALIIIPLFHLAIAIPAVIEETLDSYKEIGFKEIFKLAKRDPETDKLLADARVALATDSQGGA